MGIRFNCPSGHKLNVKEFLAGKKGVCPQCGAKFVIPTPAEASAAELPMSAANGLSQSIEIAVAPAPALQTVTTAASPSVIIPVVDVELGTPELETPPSIPGPQNPVGDALPASIIAVQSPIAAAPTEASPVATSASQRERSRRNQMVVSLLLFGLVLVLAGVLIWVLKREATPPPDEKKPEASAAAFEQVFPVAFNIANSHPRVGALYL